MIIVLMLAAAGAQVDYNKAIAPDPIPPFLRGAWDVSGRECTNQYSTTRMAVGVNWISFYESFGLVQISTPAGIPETDESLAIRFTMAGEGSSWDSEMVFGWNKATPNTLISIEAKSNENMNRERAREILVRCR